MARTAGGPGTRTGPPPPAARSPGRPQRGAGLARVVRRRVQALARQAAHLVLQQLLRLLRVGLALSVRRGRAARSGRRRRPACGRGRCGGRGRSPGARASSTRSWGRSRRSPPRSSPGPPARSSLQRRTRRTKWVSTVMPGHPEGVAEDHEGRLAAHAGQLDQVFQAAGDLAAEVVPQGGAQAHDRLGLGAEEAGRPDQLLDLLRGRPRPGPRASGSPRRGRAWSGSPAGRWSGRTGPWRRAAGRGSRSPAPDGHTDRPRPARG